MTDCSDLKIDHARISKFLRQWRKDFKIGQKNKATNAKIDKEHSDLKTIKSKKGKTIKLSKKTGRRVKKEYGDRRRKKKRFINLDVPPGINPALAEKMKQCKINFSTQDLGSSLQAFSKRSFRQ